eukprot:g10597.t1
MEHSRNASRFQPQAFPKHREPGQQPRTRVTTRIPASIGSRAVHNPKSDRDREHNQVPEQNQDPDQNQEQDPGPEPGPGPEP